MRALRLGCDPVLALTPLELHKARGWQSVCKVGGKLPNFGSLVLRVVLFVKQTSAQMTVFFLLTSSRVEVLPVDLPIGRREEWQYLIWPKTQTASYPGASF